MYTAFDTVNIQNDTLNAKNDIVKYKNNTVFSLVKNYITTNEIASGLGKVL